MDPGVNSTGTSQTGAESKSVPLSSLAVPHVSRTFIQCQDGDGGDSFLAEPRVAFGCGIVCVSLVGRGSNKARIEAVEGAWLALARLQQNVQQNASCAVLDILKHARGHQTSKPFLLKGT